MRNSAQVDKTMKWIAIVVQVCGVMLTLAGLAVVRSWLETAADTAVQKATGLRRWWDIRREHLKHKWDRLRGRPVLFSDSVSGNLTLSGSLTATRQRVERATVSDREWLANLDDRVEELHALWDTARVAERDAFDRRLADMRAEILRGTRAGGRCIAFGLVFSMVGIFLGGFA